MSKVNTVADNLSTDERYVALFIDWENIKYSLREREEEPDISALVETASRFGRVVVARAYAEWTDYEHRRTNDAWYLYRAGIDPIYVPSRPSPYSRERVKNSVDVKMCAECLETSFLQPRIKTFVLVSGDHSLLHILSSLQSRDNRVVVIGVQGNTAESIGERVDDLLYYHDIIGGSYAAADPGAPPSSPSAAKDINAVADVLVNLAREHRSRGELLLLSRLGGMLPRRMSGYRSEDYGFEKLGDLARHLAQRGKLKLIRRDDQTVVLTPEDELSGDDPSLDDLTDPRLADEPLPPPGDLDAFLEKLVGMVREQRERGGYPLVTGLGGQVSQRFRGYKSSDYGFEKFGDLVRYAERKGLLKLVSRGYRTYVLLPEDELPPDEEGDTLPAARAATPVVASFAPVAEDAVERHPDVLERIVRLADELEGRRPYMTARFLAQHLQGRNSFFPATVLAEGTPGAEAALDVDQVKVLVWQAAELGALRWDSVEGANGTVIPTVRLDRANPLVHRILAPPTPEDATEDGEAASHRAEEDEEVAAAAAFEEDAADVSPAEADAANETAQPAELAPPEIVASEPEGAAIADDQTAPTPDTTV